jgi:hypothetical protein
MCGLLCWREFTRQQGGEGKKKKRQTTSHTNIFVHGRLRDGFHGSDHCPVFLRLFPPPAAPPAQVDKASESFASSVAPTVVEVSICGALRGSAPGFSPVAAVLGDSSAEAKTEDHNHVEHDPGRCRFFIRRAAACNGNGRSGGDLIGGAKRGQVLGGDDDDDEELVAYLTYKMVCGKGAAGLEQVMDVEHTFTREDLRGKGLAGACMDVFLLRI